MDIPQVSNASQCAQYLKALGDPLRLQMVRALQAGPLSVTDLALLLEQEVGTTSHHLRVLFHADLVRTSRDGKYIYYSLSDQFRHSCNNPLNADTLDFGCCRLEMSERPQP